MIEVTVGNAINFNPQTVQDEVIQNIRTILATIVYSVPYDRDLAITGDYLDNPIPMNKALAAGDVVQAIKSREPRAEVKEVSFQGDAITGKLVPIVRFIINE